MTPKERAAMQQALEALESCTPEDTTTSYYVGKDYDEAAVYDAITALQEALAEQAEQEPVAIDGLARACNLAGIDYKDFLRIKAYLPIAAPVQQAEQEPVAWTATRLWNRKDTWKCSADIEKDLLYAAPQPMKQEPVAWVWLDDWLNDGYPEDCFSRVNHQNKTPLYSAPVSTKDLTDEEINDVYLYGGRESLGAIPFARAVIAKDREKNNPLTKSNKGE